MIRDLDDCRKAQVGEIASCHAEIDALKAQLAVAVGALERIAEPYSESWGHAECITALRHDEHEAGSALRAIAKLKGEKG